MSIKSILVQLDDSSDSDIRLKYAAEAASFFNAYLSGLYISPSSDNDTALSTTQAEHMTTNGEKVSVDISQKIQQDQPKKIRIMHTEVERSQQILFDSSRFNDLLIISKSLKSDDIFSILYEPAADIAVKCSCPVLALPSNCDISFPAQKPVVAWNNSRESARAVSDAMPFLQASKCATFFYGRPEEQRALDNDEEKNLLRYLELHDASANYVEHPLEGEDLRQALLAQIKNNQHDLLVMGAYGHSHLKELLFGSTTRGLLSALSVPVLLAH